METSDCLLHPKHPFSLPPVELEPRSWVGTQTLFLSLPQSSLQPRDQVLAKEMEAETPRATFLKLPLTTI